MRVYSLSSETIERWQWRDPLLRHLTDTLLRLAEPPNGHALDVGSGTGRVAVRFAQNGFNVDALDPVPEVIEQARALAQGLNAPVNYFVADFTRVDARFGEDSYDVVVCSEVLEHVEHWQQVVENMRRVLKPGGVLLLTVPNDPNQFSHLDTYAGHLRRFRWSELASALNGFTIEKRFTVGFPFTRTVHWTYTRILLPLFFREHRPDRMWRDQSMYGGPGAEFLYQLLRVDDLFNAWNLGTTWIVQARKS